MENSCGMLDLAPVKSSLEKIGSEVGIALSCFESIKDSLNNGFQDLSPEEKKTLDEAVQPLQSKICAIRSQMTDIFNIVVLIKNGG